MAKVFGVTPMELRPGVSGEDFAKFWIEEYAPLGLRLGWTSHVLKADRGERAGKYAVIWEQPSVEERDRVLPCRRRVIRRRLATVGAPTGTR